MKGKWLCRIQIGRECVCPYVVELDALTVGGHMGQLHAIVCMLSTQTWWSHTCAVNNGAIGWVIVIDGQRRGKVLAWVPQ